MFSVFVPFLRRRPYTRTLVLPGRLGDEKECLGTSAPLSDGVRTQSNPFNFNFRSTPLVTLVNETLVTPRLPTVDTLCHGNGKGVSDVSTCGPGSVWFSPPVYRRSVRESVGLIFCEDFGCVQ